MLTNNTKNYLFLMCGLAFSGKTVLSKKLAEKAHCLRISFDEMNEKRGLISGENIPQEEWAKTSDEALSQIKLEMEKNINIIIDDSFPFRFIRNDFKSAADQFGYRTIILFIDVSEKVIRNRIAENRKNKNRSDILDSIFDMHISEFERPALDENFLIFNPEKDEIDDWVNKIYKIYWN
jgi:predicted kinase